jgi:hypothetical protein
MRKVIFFSATTVLVLCVLGGLGAAYVAFNSQERGITSDGRLAPPASVRSAPEAPKFEASKSTPPATVEKAPEYQLPTEIDIATPQVPEGLSAPANGQKT